MLPSGFRTRKPSPAWLSTSGSPSPAWIVWHTNGRWWGPEKIGPVVGWLTSVRRSFAGADDRRLATTASVFWPSSSPVDQPHEAPVLALEGVGDVLAVALHPQLVEQAARRVDPHQGVAPAHHVGVARQDVEMNRFGMRRRGRRNRGNQRHDANHPASANRSDLLLPPVPEMYRAGAWSMAGAKRPGLRIGPTTEVSVDTRRDRLDTVSEIVRCCWARGVSARTQGAIYGR